MRNDREMNLEEQTNRLPQRFRWKDGHDLDWRYGVVFPNDTEHLGIWWTIDAVAFQWIDNDYEWQPIGAICCDTQYDNADDFREHLKNAHG